MALTDLEVRRAKPRETAYKLYDELGLFLLVKPNGSKLWRVRYTWQGKEKVLSPGPYPTVTLADARGARDEARGLLRQDIDPAVKRRTGSEGDTLRAVATRWHADREEEWSADYAIDVWRSLELHVFSSPLGERPIAAITPLELLSILRPLVTRGSRAETVRRLRQRLSEIFRLAVLEGLRQDDPASVLIDALPATRATPMRTLREDQVPAFIEAMVRGGNPLIATAVRLQLLTAVRPGEVRGATWAEIDLERALWTIPALRMKRRRTHVVPLSTQAVALLRELHLLTGHRAWLFPHRTHPSDKPMSDNTVNALITRVGYGDVLTAHGLRSLFSTVCHDRQFAAPDVIEHALAHVERSRTKRVYDRGDRLIARAPLMQRWADHIDSLLGASRARSA